jgi:radical SAM protein with 4Fe4S-binding SPASM domain
MTSDRIEEIIKQTAYPESNSVMQALKQVWHETYFDVKNEVGKCIDCKHLLCNGICKLHSEDSGENITMMNDDFCSYFERKDNVEA